MGIDVITPQWAAPAHVKAFSTLRMGGVSTGAYSSLNLGMHVGDDERRVRENRLCLQRELALPAEPVWLQQVHGVNVVRLEGSSTQGMRADASYSESQGVVCAIMTADCLPVLLCDQTGRKVAAVHAGWRGLAAGVLESTVQAMQLNPDNLLAWLGPAIGPDAFEVGEDVVTAFVNEMPSAEQAFQRYNDKWLADIYSLARQRLSRLGVQAVSGGDGCTYSEPERFFSYRRDGVTGRMATMVWIDA